jgi:DNA replication initiation complex subunit (GINS family)|tara:strand:- start:657 stop:1322 length:666 start_codon:yes stop_codon:yes gene_type:complete
MEAQQDEITITYGSLLDLLLREKDRGELQKLDERFYKNVVQYLKDKNAVVNAPQDDVFSAEEKEKTISQLVNIKKIIKELYERREKKITILAMEKSRNKDNIIDESLFLQEEKQFFDRIVQLLNDYRQGILQNILNVEPPTINHSATPNNTPTPATPTQPEPTPEKPKETKLVRFLNAVPKFVGKELEEYGPFDEEDIASLPIEIADVLLRKTRVEEIKEE